MKQRKTQEDGKVPLCSKIRKNILWKLYFNLNVPQIQCNSHQNSTDILHRFSPGKTNYEGAQKTEWPMQSYIKTKKGANIPDFKLYSRNIAQKQNITSTKQACR